MQVCQSSADIDAVTMSLRSVSLYKFKGVIYWPFANSANSEVILTCVNSEFLDTRREMAVLFFKSELNST